MTHPIIQALAQSPLVRADLEEMLEHANDDSSLIGRIQRNIRMRVQGGHITSETSLHDLVDELREAITHAIGQTMKSLPVAIPEIHLGKVTIKQSKAEVRRALFGRNSVKFSIPPETDAGGVVYV